MALPTYWVSQHRKDLAERAIVARREKEALRTKQCQEIATFHQNLARKSTKYKNLEEAKTLKTPRMHEESYVMEDLKAAAKEKVDFRRQKLAHILDVENNQYMKELELLKDKTQNKDPWNICKLKEQIEELQRQRKETEQNMHKRYTRHMLATTGSFSEETESDNLQKEVVEAWQERKEEIERLNLEKQQKELEKLERLEAEKAEATQEADDVASLHLKEQEQWMNVIEKKVNELNSVDGDSRKLEIEKGILVAHLETMLSLQRKRDAIRDIQRKAYHKIQSLWQAKEKLRRMLNEVKHGLEFDLKLLYALSDLNKPANEDSALAIVDLAEVVAAKEKVEMQIALERQRELEIQQLYHEEASKVWENKKEQWILESLARDEIITEVMKSLVNQMNRKIEFIVAEEKKLIALKENFLQEMDQINMTTKANCKTFESKHRYYVDRIDRLKEELRSKSKKIPESDSH